MIVESILDALETFIHFLIDTFGYFGIFLAMAIESACIPLPSEVIMPLSGLLVAEGELNYWLVGLMGALGNVAGSIVAYYAGMYGGRPLLERYGRFVLVNLKDLDRADRWFERYGDKAIFFSRLMPVVRTFISFPAGVSRMNLGKFTVYTFLGALPFSLALAYVGVILGKNWKEIKTFFHGFDVVIGLGLVVLIYLYVRRHVREARESRESSRSAGRHRASSEAE